jgi:hypothetical protein
MRADQPQPSIGVALSCPHSNQRTALPGHEIATTGGHGLGVEPLDLFESGITQPLGHRRHRMKWCDSLAEKPEQFFNLRHVINPE